MSSANVIIGMVFAALCEGSRFLLFYEHSYLCYSTYRLSLKECYNGM
jgi:hypothetical protein